MIEIPLRNRDKEVVAVAAVDDEDAELANLRWCRDSLGYPTRRDGRLHIFVAGRMGILGIKRCIGHRDGDRLNNQRANLHPVSQAENMGNLADPLRRDNQSGVRGVYWQTRSATWRAQGTFGGVKRSLGGFQTIEEAAAVRRQWEREVGLT